MPENKRSTRTSTKHRRIRDINWYHRHVVWIGRIAMVTVLLVVATVLGIWFFRKLSQSERELAEVQYCNIAKSAMHDLINATTRERWAVANFAVVVATMFPIQDATSTAQVSSPHETTDGDEDSLSPWPYVAVPNYEQIVHSLLQASSQAELAFVPFVQPRQQGAFEAFAAARHSHNFETDPLPENVFTPPGVWSLDPTTLTPGDNPLWDGQPYHMRNATKYDGSRVPFMAPVLQNHGDFPPVMFDLYTHPLLQHSIDLILECSKNLPRNRTNHTSTTCGIKSPVIPFPDGTMATMILQPIYPSRLDATAAASSSFGSGQSQENHSDDGLGIIPTGLIVMPVRFENHLAHYFADFVKGIDGVLSIGDASVTYKVFDGIAEFVGIGDFHDPNYDDLRVVGQITNPDLYMDETVSFAIEFYPNDELYDLYSTRNPVTASVGAACIILITSLFFFVYDFFVNRELAFRSEMLAAKRQFMRFVCHEVRTPLNSVTMAIAVIQEELAKSLGYKNVEEVIKHHDSVSPVMLPGRSDRNRYQALSSDIKNTGINSPSQQERDLDMFFMAQEVKTNALGAVDVLSDLLNYDKVQQGEFKIEKTVVPIWQLIERVCSEFILPASNKNISFGLEFAVPDFSDDEAPLSIKHARELPPDVQNLKLIGDPIRVSQILRNVISNGIKFTPQGGSLRVRVRRLSLEENSASEVNDVKLGDDNTIRARQRGRIEVAIEDSGVGLSEDQLKELFSDGKQFNVNALQAGRGSGIGLYIAAGIAEQHNGSLVASSEGLGHGSTFTLELPLWEIESRDFQNLSCSTLEQNQSFSVMEDTSIEDSTSELRILVVDDVKSNRSLLSRLLRNKGHICDEAEHGAKAVEMVQRAIDNGIPYQSILMDFEMPIMDGPTAAKAIRDMGVSDTFIIGITGNVLPDDVKYFKARGANEVLSKPVRIDSLEELWKERQIMTVSSTDF